MTDTMPTLDDRRALCNERVTLDGEPAGIAGAQLPFGHVRRIDGKGGTVEFAWPTIARIVAKGGRFES